MTRVVSAPGKVLVSGEYVVLDGAPAIVMAVDRRARVSASDADHDDWHRLSLPGIREEELEFRVDDAGAVSVRDGDGPSMDLSLIGRVWQAARPRPAGSLRLVLDTRPFFHPGSKLKLGLGSSAALAVALTAALLPGETRADDLAARALAAHRAWQGGRGSGVDIAAAVHGGVLAYRATAGGGIERLRWPEGLLWALLWSGRATGTADRIARFRRSMAGPSVRKAARRLTRAAGDVVSAWRSSNAAAALGELSTCVQALQAFDVDGGLGIFEAGHRELAEVAGGGPVVYKPCGAGGGDVGMAFALEREHLDRFIAVAEVRGFERLGVATDPRGAEEHGEQ